MTTELMDVLGHVDLRKMDRRQKARIALLDAFSAFNERFFETCDRLTVVDGYVASDDGEYVMTHLAWACDEPPSYMFEQLLKDIDHVFEEYDDDNV